MTNERNNTPDDTIHLPLCVMPVVDGNGESEILGLMLAADDRQETLRQMMVYFKDFLILSGMKLIVLWQTKT